MEQKKRNIIFNKSGGNSGKNATGVKLSLPKPWLTQMGVTEEQREVILTFEDNRIIIEKANN